MTEDEYTPTEDQSTGRETYDENATGVTKKDISRVARVDPELASEMYFLSKQKKYGGRQD